MNKFLILIVILSLFSCSELKNQDKEKIKVEKTASEKVDGHIDLLLEFESKKIVLLSIIKNTSEGKVRSILRDYLAGKYNSTKNFKDSVSFRKLISDISKDNKVSKSLTASIIFSFEYEMITKEEVIDEYIGENE